MIGSRGDFTWTTRADRLFAEPPAVSGDPSRYDEKMKGQRMSRNARRHRGDSSSGRFTGGRAASFVAAGTAVTLAAGAIVAAGGGTAGAVVPLKAQSVGRFVDGSAGGMPIQKLADLKDARATAPPEKGTQQNPFDVKLFNMLNIPLTGVFNFPTSPAVKAGVVNQVAVAKDSGRSYGAAGAVSNSGGINAGGNSNDFPSSGTIDLSGSSFGSSGLPPLPGGGGANALGGLTADIGAVSALAQTQVGGKVTPQPQYNVAGVRLNLASPALGGVLTKLGDALNPSSLPVLPGAPEACTFKKALLSPISFAGGGIKIDPTTGAITVDVAKLLLSLKLNINKLPANTDLLAYLLKYLADPKGLAAGLQGTLTSITQPGQDRFTACLTAIGKHNPALQTLADAITSGSASLTAATKNLSDALAKAAPGGSNPFAPLAMGLKSLIDIGINVESGPGIQQEQTDPSLKFDTGLKKTPNQNTPVVPNQTLIRALEINLLRVSGPPGLPGNFARPAAVAPNTTGITVALANAAVGPSSVPAAAPPTPLTGVPGNQLPTGVPAGQGKPDNGSPTLPTLPLVLVLLGLMLAGGGTVALRRRGMLGQ